LRCLNYRAPRSKSKNKGNGDGNGNGNGNGNGEGKMPQGRLRTTTAIHCPYTPKRRFTPRPSQVGLPSRLCHHAPTAGLASL